MQLYRLVHNKANRPTVYFLRPYCLQEILLINALDLTWLGLEFDVIAAHNGMLARLVTVSSILDE